MRKPKDPAGEWPLPLYKGYKAPKAGKYEKLMREAMARDAENRREQAKSTYGSKYDELFDKLPKKGK